eukprot:12740417-Alexandrium_andersonii.AAC.1
MEFRFEDGPKSRAEVDGVLKGVRSGPTEEGQSTSSKDIMGIRGGLGERPGGLWVILCGVPPSSM